MWFEGARLDSIRHECRHEDDIKRWGWKEFSENRYGKESLKDIHNYVKLDLNYLKEGDDWVLEVQGNRLAKERVPRNVSLVFYLSVSGSNGTLSLPTLSKKQAKQVIDHVQIIRLICRDMTARLIFHSFPTTMAMVVFRLLKVSLTSLLSI